jgi:hypothetical protein
MRGGRGKKGLCIGGLRCSMQWLVCQGAACCVTADAFTAGRIWIIRVRQW